MSAEPKSTVSLCVALSVARKAAATVTVCGIAAPPVTADAVGAPVEPGAGGVVAAAVESPPDE